ncbi:hypothetical protein CIL05_07000 [Virgibacillus profundi]|uniref:Uncharacterized protein n=1 Tax=Virgibacillus profundi TaxID=2024555 RepID=A0A2A2IEY7_9BACI|nr:hypothetical protein [Virgibacillus profundi]PAV30207.1 hypothetical protein CIL05_07000 [Virgibacillus profundi]PXY54379.1 hypothetical protein CIT14_07085 [Virgibacillus profundi]
MDKYFIDISKGDNHGFIYLYENYLSNNENEITVINEPQFHTLTVSKNNIIEISKEQYSLLLEVNYQGLDNVDILTQIFKKLNFKDGIYNI